MLTEQQFKELMIEMKEQTREMIQANKSLLAIQMLLMRGE